MTEEENLAIDIFIDENHDFCTECDYKFIDHDDEICVIGFNKENELVNCCLRCEGNVINEVHRTSFYERKYETPRANSVLWRYMDFSKYVSLLSTSSLFFAGAGTFDDSLEGAQGIKSNKPVWDEHYLTFFNEAIKNPPDGGVSPLEEKDVNAKSLELLKQLEFSGKHLRDKNYISCWHENDHESEAMWRLYSSYMENAVAIRTTYKDLSASINPKKRKNIQIGRIKYINFKKEFSGVNSAFWRKNISFEHEKEVRALYCELNKVELGKLIKCDLNILINSIHVSAKAPAWLKDTLNDVNKKYGVAVEVSESELTATAFY